MVRMISTVIKYDRNIMMKKLFTLIAAVSLMAACSEDVTTNRPDGDKQFVSFSVTCGDAISGQTQNSSTRSNSPLIMDSAPWMAEQMSQPAIKTKVVEVETDLPSEEPLFLTITDEPFIRRTNNSGVTRGALLNSGDAASLSFGVTEYPTGVTNIASAKWVNSHPQYKEMISSNVALFKAPQTWEYDAYDDVQYDFYAYAPWQDAGAGQGIELSTNRLSIAYDPTDVPANEQPDLMTAPKVTSAYVGAIPLTFHHRLCAIQIKAGSTWPSGYKMSGISFSNIYYKADFDISTETWGNYNGSGAKDTYSLTTATGGLTEADTAGDEIAGDTDSNWIMMVPQTLDGVKLSISIKDGGDNEYTITAPINNSIWRAGHTITYTVSPESIDLDEVTVSYPSGSRAWSGIEDGPITSYASGQEFGLFVVDKDGNVLVSNATATAVPTVQKTSLVLPSGIFFSKQYKYFLMYPKLSDSELSDLLTLSIYNSKYKANGGSNSATRAEVFFDDVINKWSVKGNQSSDANFKGSDLQIGMLSGKIFPMKHMMGLVKLQMTAKAVPLTKTLTYSTLNSGSPTSTVFSTPNDEGSVSPSTDFTGNIPYSGGGNSYYYIVKSTGEETNSDVSFTCNANQKDFWSAKSSGTDIGYGKYKAITVQSDRDCLNFIALFDCVKTAQTVAIPWYGEYKLECWGAQGGDQSRTNNSAGTGYGSDPYGGRGAYVSGHVTLSKDLTLNVYVGEEGGYNNTSSSLTFNGGGHGANQGSGDGAGSRGGGATDIRTVIHSEANGWGGDESLNSRIIVAAGGGGCTTYGTVTYGSNDPSAKGRGNGSGGAAGGLIGYPGNTTYKSAKQSVYDNNEYSNAQGGSQSAGGAGWYYAGAFSNGVAGGKGYGGSTNSQREGGGGSGLYGGGSGGVDHSIVGAGAGGSSFISGHPGCSTVSGYSFSSTQMIDGKGLSWTSAGQTTGGSAVQMPTTSGGLEALNTGHSGHGYAKISSQ